MYNMCVYRKLRTRSAPEVFSKKMYSHRNACTDSPIGIAEVIKAEICCMLYFNTGFFTTNIVVRYGSECSRCGGLEVFKKNWHEHIPYHMRGIKACHIKWANALVPPTPFKGGGSGSTRG